MANMAEPTRRLDFIGVTSAHRAALPAGAAADLSTQSERPTGEVSAFVANILAA